MRCLALLFCLISFSAQARPSPYPVTPFDGDKYSARQAQMATDVARAAKAKRGAKARKAAPTRRHTSPRAKQRRWIVPIPAPRPIAEPGTVDPMSWGGFDRVEAPVSIGDGLQRAAKWVAGAVAQPSRFIGGHLICARNVNAALAERGIKGTGSALAKSFLGWGRPSGAVPGAVAVYNRGKSAKSGHAAIVAFVKNGVPYVWNPSRRGWRLQAYRKRAIAYRVPS